MFSNAIAGKTVLVTGASSGLGAHFSDILAAQGGRVIMAARRLDALEKGRDEIRATGGKAEAIALDISSDEAVAACMAQYQPDIVINNAGITTTKSALDMEIEEFTQILDVNLTGGFRVAQAAAKQMVEAGNKGCIVNVASILGLRVAGQVSAYATSKAAVIQLTKSLALEWARYGIRVNALCPGYIETPLNRDFFNTPAGQTLVKRIPLRRLGQLHELDAPLLLLASDAGSFVTGTTLCADGGHLVSSL